MAARQQTAAFISVSSVTNATADERTWDLLLSENGCFEIQDGATYNTTVRYLEASDSAWDIAMTGVTTGATHAAISTALKVQAADQSDVPGFNVGGLQQSDRIAFLLDGRLIGSSAVTHADLAFDAIKECIVSRAANFEA